ncbi:hypothetical protein BsWGS_16973 [Bradybaena similaris]
MPCHFEYDVCPQLSIPVAINHFKTDILPCQEATLFCTVSPLSLFPSKKPHYSALSLPCLFSPPRSHTILHCLSLVSFPLQEATLFCTVSPLSLFPSKFLVDTTY